MTFVSHQEDARTAWRLITELFMMDEVHDRFHEACAAVGLPHPGSLKALLLLDPDEPPSMRAMAESMHCDASYITSLVDELEKLDYVERVVSTGDRRVKLIHLTPTGVTAREHALDVLATPPTTMKLLTPTDTKSLARILKKLVPQP